MALSMAGQNKPLSQEAQHKALTHQSLQATQPLGVTTMKLPMENSPSKEATDTGNIRLISTEKIVQFNGGSEMYNLEVSNSQTGSFKSLSQALSTDLSSSSGVI